MATLIIFHLHLLYLLIIQVGQTLLINYSSWTKLKINQGQLTTTLLPILSRIHVSINCLYELILKRLQKD